MARESFWRFAARQAPAAFAMLWTPLVAVAAILLERAAATLVDPAADPMLHGALLVLAMAALGYVGKVLAAGGPGGLLGDGLVQSRTTPVADPRDADGRPLFDEARALDIADREFEQARILAAYDAPPPDGDGETL